MMSRFTEKMEQMLQRPVWVIDILPEQVVSCPPGKYFTVEKYFLKDSEVIRKKRNLALKLNCFYDLEILVDDTELSNPPPEDLAALIEEKYLNIQVGDALLVIDPTSTHMSLFNADDKLLDLVRSIAAGEGLFVWQPARSNV